MQNGIDFRLFLLLVHDTARGVAGVVLQLLLPVAATAVDQVETGCDRRLPSASTATLVLDSVLPVCLCHLAAAALLHSHRFWAVDRVVPLLLFSRILH